MTLLVWGSKVKGPMLGRLVVGLGIAVALVIGSSRADVSLAAQSEAARPREALAIIGSDGVTHPFQVEVMRTEQQRWRGLRWRKHLDPDDGMLFDLDGVRVAYFTMSDTLIPLDMLFIAADGRIVSIAERTVPGNPGPYASAVPVRAVLELNGGTCAKLDIKPGDLVRYQLFGQAAPAAPSSGASGGAS